MSQNIYFSDSIYKKEAVEKSVQDYQELATFTMKESEAGVAVEIDNIHPSFTDVLVDAFCNHVLNETIIQNRKETGGDL
jgi:hypothetical protein